ncbi:MAG: hypothetical protein WCO12_03220 [bacterium]
MKNLENTVAAEAAVEKEMEEFLSTPEGQELQTKLHTGVLDELQYNQMLGIKFAEFLKNKKGE